MLEYIFVPFFCAQAVLNLLYLVLLTRIESVAKTPAIRDGATQVCPSITYVRPMKGVDAGTERCIRSLYLEHATGQTHARVIYSFERSDDPAVALVRAVAAEYADRMPTDLVFATLEAHNPKMANCVEAYEQAKTEWVGLLDSNVECYPGFIAQYERYCVPAVKVAGGCLHGVMASDDVSARIEYALLYAFFGKGTLLAEFFGHAPVNGKTMLVHKPSLDAMGGLRGYKDKFNEDGEIGLDMARRYGTAAVPLMHCEAPQRVVKTSLEALVDRFARWAVYRKLRAPLLFWTEPMLYPLSSTLLAAASCGSWTGAALFFVVHAAFVATEAHYAHAAQERTAPVKLSYAEMLWSIVLSNAVLLSIWTKAAAARTVFWKNRHYSVDPRSGNMVYYGK